MPTQTRPEATERIRARLAGEIQPGDMEKDLAFRDGFERFRAWYWKVTRSQDEVPAEIHEEELAFLEARIPKLYERNREYIEAKIRRGEFVKYVPPTRAQLEERHPGKRIWASWELDLIEANLQGFDMYGLTAELQHARQEGRILPEKFPFTIYTQRGIPAVPFPPASVLTGRDKEHHTVFFVEVETDADRKEHEKQARWYATTWANFHNATRKALATGEPMPTARIAAPRYRADLMTLDETLAAEASQALIQGNPRLRAQHGKG